MAAKKPAKAGASSTVTLKHLAARVAEDHEMAKKQAEAVLGSMVDLIVKHLKKGDRIRIGGCAAGALERPKDRDDRVNNIRLFGDGDRIVVERRRVGAHR